MAGPVSKYGVKWPAGMKAVEIERTCIRKGGRWKIKGVEVGAGLMEHYKEFFSLCWPEDHHNRWSDLVLSNLLTNRITVVQGPKNSQKTRTASKWALTKYWAFPENTMGLMTSTDRRGLQLRVWGDIKHLFNRAKERFPFLEGNVIEASDAIFTDDILNEGKTGARDWRKGIIGVPTLTSTGDYNGLALKNYAGIKAEHRFIVGDEIQFVPVEYLKIFDSLDDGDFSACLLGNPIANNGKALDKVAEPEKGWGSTGEVTKTTTWKNKYGGVTVQLVGIDSPNFDKPLLKFYPKLICQEDADRMASRPGGKDSREWWSLIMGVRKAGAVDNRVLTVAMVESTGGFDDCLWEGETTRILGVDAGFGGDPCVATYSEFGLDVKGNNLLKFNWQDIIPIKVSGELKPEKQIAVWCRDKGMEFGIPPENMFFECGMRATLGVECALEIGNGINAVNAGGPSTQRPVNSELFIIDQKTGEKRLKTCYEHYSKFVTEMAFSVRELVVGGQARNFPRQAAEEFERRECDFVYGSRHELETKSEYKKRSGGESPNLSDSAMINVEGARQRGFILERIVENGGESKPRPVEKDWLGELARDQKQIDDKRELVYD